jgi:DNA-binding response OmpR family regulator
MTKKRILLLLKTGFKFESVIRNYLEQEGFLVYVAKSVAEVLEKAKRFPPFLLIIEQDTYEMDCLELILNVRDVQPHIRVLVLGSQDPENKAEIIGLDGIYLDSPIKVDALREAISRLS